MMSFAMQVRGEMTKHGAEDPDETKKKVKPVRKEVRLYLERFFHTDLLCLFPRLPGGSISQLVVELSTLRWVCICRR